MTVTMRNNSSITNNARGILCRYGTVIMRDSSRIVDNSLVNSGNYQQGGGILVSFGTFIMQDNARITGNTATAGGGGLHISSTSTFQMEGGTIYGNSGGRNSNLVVVDSASVNDRGAALNNDGLAVRGRFDGDTFVTTLGGLNTTDNTISVSNGLLQ